MQIQFFLVPASLHEIPQIAQNEFYPKRPVPVLDAVGNP
jgi:hypothetical protein